MRTSVVLVIAGVALVVIGIAYADRSWGWTYALAVLGAVTIADAALHRARGSRLSAHRSARDGVPQR